MIQGCQEYANWTAISTDTTTVASSAVSLYGTTSVSYARADGSANTTIGGIYDTYTGEAVMFLKGHWFPHDYIYWLIYVSSLSNVASSFVRLGTSASHHVEYRYADSSMIAGWNLCSSQLGKGYLVGNGLNWEDVEYIAVGTNHDAVGDELAGILVNGIYLLHLEETS